MIKLKASFIIVVLLLCVSPSWSISESKWATGIVEPGGLAVATDGSIIVADVGALRIWRIVGDRLEIVAGSGRGGFTEDGVLAKEARLSDLDDVAVDSSGNVYFTEARGTRVRKVNTKGILSTFAGTGKEEISGDGGPAVKAGVGNVSGIAIDSNDNVFLSEWMEGGIRRVDKSGIISTFVTGEDLDTPADMLFDDHGNLFVVDVMGSKIVKIDPNGNLVTTAGGKDNKNTKFDMPRGIAFDSEGKLLVADNGNSCLRRIERDGTMTTITTSKQSAPYRLAAGKDGIIYVSANNLLILSPDGTTKPVFVPDWKKQPKPDRETFLAELLDPEYTPATRLFDDYTEGSYHVNKVEVLTEIQKYAQDQNRKLIGFFAVGPYGPLWSYDVIAFFEENDGVRANRLIMPHARITYKGTTILTMKEYINMMNAMRSTEIFQANNSNSTDADNSDSRYTVLIADWSSGEIETRYAAIDFSKESSAADRFQKVFDELDKLFKQTY